MAARVYDEVFGYIEDATKTLPGAAAPGELPGELVGELGYGASTSVSVFPYCLLANSNIFWVGVKIGYFCKGNVLCEKYVNLRLTSFTLQNCVPWLPTLW